MCISHSTKYHPTVHSDERKKFDDTIDNNLIIIKNICTHRNNNKRAIELCDLTKRNNWKRLNAINN